MILEATVDNEVFTDWYCGRRLFFSGVLRFDCLGLLNRGWGVASE